MNSNRTNTRQKRDEREVGKSKAQVIRGKKLKKSFRA